MLKFGRPRDSAGGADGVEPPRVPGVRHADWYHALKQKGATVLIWTVEPFFLRVFVELFDEYLV